MRLISLGYRLALGWVLIGLVGCDPIPRRNLTSEEKVADLYWVYSQFGENYAPLELKEKLYHFDFEKLKADYVEAAKATRSNDEFYSLMMRFVAEFKDAHTSASLTNSSLPNRAQVAFLGFSGYRQGGSLIVKKLLPTISNGSAYPIAVGDEVLKIDGVTLKEAIVRDLVPLRNLGNDESNLTYHMNKLFNRVSTVNGLPANRDALITIKRENREFQVTLPWVFKDLVQFQAEQRKATDAKVKTENYLMVSEDESHTKIFGFNFIGFDGKIEMPFDRIQKVTNRIRKRFADGFRFIDNVASWSLIEEKPKTESPVATTPLQDLKSLRSVPDHAVYIEGSKTFPAYVVQKFIPDQNGNATKEKRLIGYILVDTFSPDDSEDEVIKEFKQTLSSMQILGVQNLIIDTINNGGGSLVLGMKMAQLLTPKKIEMPKMQFRLSDSWLDQFESESLEASSDAEREYSRRLLSELLEQKQIGNRLSIPYEASVLAPFSIKENQDLEQPFKVALLVNEMCASMCDIFAGILQDNQMATLIGARTMGAGGNVVDYNQAPNSHLELRQTESLMVRKELNADQSLSYIENAGVEPSIELKINEMAKAKYKEAIEKATEVLLK